VPEAFLQLVKKCVCGLGSALDSSRGAYNAPPEPKQLGR